ncbi:hypothetical protein HK405_007471 [Cladochytrium tenue]|nr:hypothetical protein HK405_007471 [Cladochytrium tenue]
MERVTQIQNMATTSVAGHSSFAGPAAAAALSVNGSGRFFIPQYVDGTDDRGSSGAGGSDLEERIRREGAENDAAYFLPSDDAERKRLHLQPQDPLSYDHRNLPANVEFKVEDALAGLSCKVGWNGPLGNLAASDFKQVMTGASKRAFMQGREEAVFDNLVEDAFKQAVLTSHSALEETVAESASNRGDPDADTASPWPLPTLRIIK